MDVHIVASMLLFYGALIEAKEALRSYGGNIAEVLENNLGEDKSKVLAVVIVKNSEESTEVNSSDINKEPMLPFIDQYRPKDYDEDTSDITDTSGESNSDEYPNSEDTDLDSDSESDSDHEDDYVKDKVINKIHLLDSEKQELELLRNRWKSCQKAQYKTCRDACKAAVESACEQKSCKRKLKKCLKKECKVQCKDFFIE